MKCIYCPVELSTENYKGLTISKCPQCGALWIEKATLRDFKDRTDEFLCWLKIDLWEKDEHHHVTKGNKRCTQCGEMLHNIDYKGSHVIVPVCVKCQGVWLDAKNREELFKYLEQIVTSETVSGFLKEIGSETLELVTGKENFKNEINDLKTILVLIEYRIFSKFPVLEKIISGFPK